MLSYLLGSSFIDFKAVDLLTSGKVTHKFKVSVKSVGKLFLEFLYLSFLKYFFARL